MANYSSLLAAVNAAITANGTGAITGPVLNTVLQQMIVSLGQGGYIFKGRAIPTTDPGSPDQNVFYIATTPGTYTNFSGIVVAAGECAILKGSGTSWSKEATGIDLVSVSQNTQTLEIGGEEVGALGGVYVENPEWVDVTTDTNGVILYGVKSDGKFYFGAGCPPQVQEYISNAISTYSYSKSAIDTLLGAKVDKVTGKSLIDANFATEMPSVLSMIEDPEYLEVVVDEDYKIIEGITKSGRKEINIPIDTPSSSSESIDNPEWIEVKTDEDGGILEGIRKDGNGTKQIFVPIAFNKASGETLNLNKLNLTSQGIEDLKEDMNVAVSRFIGEPNTTVDFQVAVNVVTTLQSTDDNALSMLDSQTLQNDNCKLMLPSNYTKTGKPVPLMICPHGGGGTCNDITTSVVSKYFCANGFAVADCTGVPSAWAASNSVGTSHCANPMAMECYTKLYQYIIEKYNVEQDIVLVGGSMGGMTSIQIAQLGNIPVKAIGVYCPVTDLYNQAFLNPWGVAVKRHIGLTFGFEHIGQSIDDNFVYDEEKVRGYNPIVNGMISMDTDGKIVPSDGTYDFTNHTLNGESVKEYHKFPYPIKIWHCKDDTTVNYACSVRFVDAIRNYGGAAILRPIATGGHGPTNMGGQVANPIGNNVFRGETLDIRGITEEIYIWIERFVRH